MENQALTLSAALLAGLLSFFSPCVLPLVPVYLAYMTGTAAESATRGARLVTLAHAIAFVLGFGLVFVTLGSAAGLLGRVLAPLMPIIVRIGGLVLIVFGLHMSGLVAIPWLNLERRIDLRGQRPRGYGTSLLIGLVFAAGWTPCIGPVLSAILLLAADSQTALAGAVLLAAYALGLAVPFLVVAALLDVAKPALRRLSRHLRIASIVGGILLVVMGILLVLDLFTAFSFWLASLLPAS